MLDIVGHAASMVVKNKREISMPQRGKGDFFRVAVAVAEGDFHSQMPRVSPLKQKSTGRNGYHLASNQTSRKQISIVQSVQAVQII
jgi:hypothetical protein